MRPQGMPATTGLQGFSLEGVVDLHTAVLWWCQDKGAIGDSAAGRGRRRLPQAHDEGKVRHQTMQETVQGIAVG